MRLDSETACYFCGQPGPTGTFIAGGTGTVPACDPPCHRQMNAMGWPNTPGTQAYGLAAAALRYPKAEHTAQARADAQRLLETLDGESLSRAAETEYEEWRGDAEPTDVALWLAGDADTTETMGLAVQSHYTAHWNFARLLRHPQWTGLCSILPTVAGLRTIIIESSKHPGQPGAAIAFRPEARDTEALLPHDIPEGEPAQLRDLLKWHGAADCLWLPNG